MNIYCVNIHEYAVLCVLVTLSLVDIAPSGAPDKPFNALMKTGQASLSLLNCNVSQDFKKTSGRPKARRDLV